MSDADRNSILDAVYVLNDIFDALVAGTMVFERYQSEYLAGRLPQTGIVAVQKMCVSHIIMGLSRFVEFWDHYHSLVPDELRSNVEAVLKKLRSKDMKQYRNTMVAHIRDRKLGRAQTQFEAMKLLNQISDDNPKAFLAWLNNPNEHVYPKTVVSIVAKLRDHLSETHGVSAAEVFKR